MYAKFDFSYFISLFFVAHTVAKRIMDDIEQNRLTNLHDVKSGGDGLISLAHSRQIRCVSYDDWKKLDAHETTLGVSRGKPREKILNIEKMLELTSPSKS
jgi:adrenodoxin-NADP+ reductase